LSFLQRKLSKMIYKTFFYSWKVWFDCYY